MGNKGSKTKVRAQGPTGRTVFHFFVDIPRPPARMGDCAETGQRAAAVVSGRRGDGVTSILAIPMGPSRGRGAASCEGGTRPPEKLKDATRRDGQDQGGVRTRRGDAPCLAILRGKTAAAAAAAAAGLGAERGAGMRVRPKLAMRRLMDESIAPASHGAPRMQRRLS